MVRAFLLAFEIKIHHKTAAHFSWRSGMDFLNPYTAQEPDTGARVGQGARRESG